MEFLSIDGEHFIMTLRDLNFKRIYRSNDNNIADIFLGPALKEALTYERGTGYFSLSSLSTLADGLIPFIHNGGSIKIVTSVQLSYEDMKIIKKGLELQKSFVEERLSDLIHEKLSGQEKLLKLDIITNLIASGRLIIKIAYMPKGGIYHEKFGFLFDKQDGIYFMGSLNETFSGLKVNHESIIVLTTWKDSFEEINEQHRYFEQLWDNKISSLEVFSIPEAVEKELLKLYKVSPDLKTAIEKWKSNEENFNIKKLYNYQEKAIREFKNNKYCHFYEMATGTGKTFTAIKAYEQLVKDIGKVLTIVIVPQIDLQNQWLNAFQEVGVTPLLFGGLANASATEKNISRFILASYNGATKQFVAISTYDTFFSKVYNRLTNLGCEIFLIVDEAHNLNSNQIKKLPDSFSYRLGLSATPERYNLADTKSIISYFTLDRVETFKYTIEEAINNGFLAHYKYFPVEAPLTEDEFLEYKIKTKQYIIAKNEKEPDEQKIQGILRDRSNIIKKSTNKLNVLENIVKRKKYDFLNSVIYCGSGKDYETEDSIIDSVTKILAVEGGYKVSQFTSKTVDRISVLKEFEAGNYDILAAIKCFDEGVDVPKLEKIFILASDGLKRQTIQRRGRVLRKCKETGKTIAYIYDFIALPPKSTDKTEFGGANLVGNELKRVLEYGRLADNKNDIDNFIDTLVKSYDIDLEMILAEENNDGFRE